MNRLKYSIAFLFILFSLNAFAQSGLQEGPYIEVRGTAEQEIIPDQLYIHITLKERIEDKEKITIDNMEERLKAALKEIGIDLKTLSLSDASADYVKVIWHGKDILSKKDYSLLVNDAGTLGKVFQQLDKLEIDDAYISKVSHSKIDSLKKEVKIAAIKAAKQKADYLLAAIGEQTGKALIVQEQVYENTRFESTNVHMDKEPSYFAGSVKALVDRDKDADLQFKKIKIEAHIFVKFAIK